VMQTVHDEGNLTLAGSILLGASWYLDSVKKKPVWAGMLT